MTALRSVVAAIVLVIGVLEAQAATGRALPGLEPYDEFMTTLIRKWEVAGAGLAVARQDKLLLARGYGFANLKTPVRVEPTSLFLAIDGWRGPALLNPATVAQMNAGGERPATADDDEDKGEGATYGLGIRVRQVKNGLNLWHAGSLPGTSALAVRTADGFAWVVTFNGRPHDRGAFRGEVDRGLWAAKRKVKTWPDGDLFGP